MLNNKTIILTLALITLSHAQYLVGRRFIQPEVLDQPKVQNDCIASVGSFLGQIENSYQQSKKDGVLSLDSVKALSGALHSLASSCANISMPDPSEECLASVPAMVKDVIDISGGLDGDINKIIVVFMDLVFKVQDTMSKCGCNRFNAMCGEMVTIAQKKSEAVRNGESYDHEQMLEIIRGMKAACF